MGTMTWDRIVSNGGEVPNGVHRIERSKDFRADHGLVDDGHEIANARTSEHGVANAG
jgi:hypothetical protein